MIAATEGLVALVEEMDRARRRTVLASGLAQVVRTLLLFLLVLGAFLAGRLVEQRSQLGRLLVLAPALEDLEAATRSADSLGMRLLIYAGRRHPMTSRR